MPKTKPDSALRPAAPTAAAAVPAGPGPDRKPEDDRLREIDKLRARVATLETANEELTHNLSLLNETRDRLGAFSERLTMINRFTQEINTLDLNRILELALARIPHLVDAKFMSIFFHDPDTDELVLQRHNHPNEINRRIVLRCSEHTVMGIALRRREPVLIRDLDEYQATTGTRIERTFADKYATRSCVSLPLVAGPKLLGVINLADKKDGGSFDEINDLPHLEQAAQFLGVVLQNCFLFLDAERHARTDGLTRLLNHRSFYDGLTREVHRSKRYGHVLSLIMCDVDNFKGINDSYGHPVGDKVIQAIGRAICQFVRTEDVAARYGGDEFAILLPETPLVGATVVAERIRDRMATFDFSKDGITLPIRLSFGIAEQQPGWSPNDLVQAADQALYDAKRAGKDTIRQASAS